MNSANNTAREEGSRPFLVFLVATALLCGALVMVIEVLGSRVIGPFFGVSLFVWTSLITVTLLSLAAGYAVGGVVSDRKKSPDWLYGIIMVAGLLVLLIPVIKNPVLKAFLAFGLRGGSLLSSLVLFGPTLFLLGCVSPYLIKIAAREMTSIGRTVGSFYAVSTAGSFAGTVLTGFVLITYFSVSRIFEVTGILLMLLSASYFIFFRKRWMALPLLLVALPLHYMGLETDRSFVRPGGAKVTVAYSRDTFYGKLKVIDYDYGVFYTRKMAINGQVQGGIDINNGMSIYSYSYSLGFIPYLLNPGGKNCLVIGLGAGVVPNWYESMGVQTDSVEIDPEVVEVAEKYFGFKYGASTTVADARYFLGKGTKEYDYVILDIFSGDTTPAHVLSLESLMLVKERMASGGVFAMNFMGSLRDETFMTASVIKTLKEVFSEVDIYPGFLPGDGEGFGNMTIVARDGDLPPFRREMARGFPVHPMARPAVDKFIGYSFILPVGADAIVLTDDYNPIDVYDTWLKEALRKNIFRDSPIDVLL